MKHTNELLEAVVMATLFCVGLLIGGKIWSTHEERIIKQPTLTLDWAEKRAREDDKKLARTNFGEHFYIRNYPRLTNPPTT